MREQPMSAAGHERRDANVRMIVLCACLLLVAGLIVHLGIAGFYQALKVRFPSSEAPSRIASKTEMTAPQPRLQTNPAGDLEDFAAAENRQLNTYGWVDKEAGLVRIPIARAMEMIARRGLPTRGPATENTSGVTEEQLGQQKAAPRPPAP